MEAYNDFFSEIRALDATDTLCPLDRDLFIRKEDLVEASIMHVELLRRIAKFRSAGIAQERTKVVPFLFHRRYQPFEFLGLGVKIVDLN